MGNGIRIAAALALLAMAMPAALDAQRHRGAGAVEGAGFFMIGWQRLDLSDLNPRLVSAGYPSLGEDFVSIGGGGHTVRQRVVIGGEGHGLVGPTETTVDGAFRTRLAGGYGLFTLGYVLAETERARIYPLLGIGAGGLTLSILDRSAPSFDEVLVSPQRSARLSTGGLLLDGSVGATLRLTESRRRDGQRGGLTLGIRAGWGFSPISSEWRTDAGNDVAGGPDAMLGGGYVRVMLGGWGTRPPRR